MRTNMLIGCFTLALVAGFAGTASASTESSAKDAKDDGSEDLLEALDYGKLVDTNVDENGVTWETYYDEVTKVLWTQTAGAPKDAVLESIESGGEYLEAGTGGGAGLDYICAYQWLYPHTLTIYDDASNYLTLDSSAAYYVGACDTNCRAYRYNEPECGDPTYTNICGYIQSITKTSSSFNYCSGYNAYYWDLDSGGAWNDGNDYQSCWLDGSYRLYGMSEDGDISCESQWDYGTGTYEDYTPVGRHKFYACEAWHYTETWYGFSIC